MSTSIAQKEDVDGRDKPGHDGVAKLRRILACEGIPELLIGKRQPSRTEDTYADTLLVVYCPPLSSAFPRRRESMSFRNKCPAIMQHGFYLFIDEAGDEGISRIRPVDPEGSSEYFVLCGILLRSARYQEINFALGNIKKDIGLAPSENLHFRDLTNSQKIIALTEIAKLRFGLVAIVSNKQNMRGYRNIRCEQKNIEYVRGRARPRQHNWFYNNLFRYLLERASHECARWSPRLYGSHLPIKIIFSRRKNFSYSQTISYLYQLKTARHGPGYFNSRGQINWSVVDPMSIESKISRAEGGLQLADCAASAIFRALDETWFEKINPEYLELLSGRLVKMGSTPRDYGFKLLPHEFSAHLSDDQRKGLSAVGYHFDRRE